MGSGPGVKTLSAYADEADAWRHPGVIQPAPPTAQAVGGFFFPAPLRAAANLCKKGVYWITANR